jgi:hypothetical protein
LTTQLVTCLVGATAAAGVLSLALVGPQYLDLGQVVRPRVTTLRKLAGLGPQGETGNVLQPLNYRLDQHRAGVRGAGGRRNLRRERIDDGYDLVMANAVV